MLQHPFAIEFYYPAEINKSMEGTRPKYHAVITTLSKGFRLFKVSEIKKITGNRMTEINECYHLTSYPLHEEKDECWKDALTMYSDSFLQAIGEAIEKHIYSVQKIAPYLN